MVVPGGGTGSRGGSERGSESEVEGGAGGIGTGGGGRGTLSGFVSKTHISHILKPYQSDCPFRRGSMDWTRVMRAYRGLADRLASKGPGGHARNGTAQHDEFRPSDRLAMDVKGRDSLRARRRRGGEGGGGCTGEAVKRCELRSKVKFLAGGGLGKTLTLIGCAGAAELTSVKTGCVDGLVLQASITYFL
jgi:hypothetical protein